MSSRRISGLPPAQPACGCRVGDRFTVGLCSTGQRSAGHPSRVSFFSLYSRLVHAAPGNAKPPAQLADRDLIAVVLESLAESRNHVSRLVLGLNWWATRGWKFGVGWGHTSLDRFGTTGVTEGFQTRVQWIY